MDELNKRIYLGENQYADSELHIWLYVDLVRISSESSAEREQMDVFEYLVSNGFSYIEANMMMEEHGERTYKMSRDAMLFDRLQNSKKQIVCTSR